MTWTYDNTDPAGTDKDHVRLLSGDTTETAKHTLQNEEITAFLATEGTVKAAAIKAARSLAARYAREPDVKIGKTSVSNSQISRMYRETADEIEFELEQGADIFVGGISEDDKESRQADTDAIPSRFQRAQDDNFGRIERLNNRLVN